MVYGLTSTEKPRSDPPRSSAKDIQAAVEDVLENRERRSLILLEMENYGKFMKRSLNYVLLQNYKS